MRRNRDRYGRVDRRTTIKWLAAAMAAAQTGCGDEQKYLRDEIPPATAAGAALLGDASPAGGAGYGTDPDVLNPAVPWPLTMTDAQRHVTSSLCDMILPADDHSPAASAVGVPDFIDEWVSAPYPQQQSDREVILAGLEWLERQSRSDFGTSFVAAPEYQREELLNRLAYPAEDAPGLEQQIEFFRRFRYLTVGAFYTTEPGMQDAGYVGNVAIAGEYPGPSDAALEHLNGVLEQLGLSGT